ncbi:uncharacterized protein LOC122094229 [Macadamia integrifolia]|uniref:uncharacterized protein LOC122094229 n=1 Tax=Macadamia integrifolia TaxID=60698 RepID=UPI001C533B82|nr:uncharacterized protein LOC122094229 [Macadamia integrifolia]
MASTKLSVVVFVINLTAFVLAIGAEHRRSTARATADSNFNYYYCVYTSDVATKVGMGASLLLMATHVLIMMQTRLFFLDKALNPKVPRAWALVLFVGCWITFCVVEVCLVGGSLINAQHTKHRFIIIGDLLPSSCQTLRRGVFAAGAAFTVLTTICSQFYYLYYSKDLTEQSFVEEALIKTLAEAAEQN